jgi:hypothetical protein
MLLLELCRNVFAIYHFVHHRYVSVEVEIEIVLVA